MNLKSEKELIKQIRALKTIKPDNDWAVSVKAQILGQTAATEKSHFFVLFKNLTFQYRAVLAGLLLIIGTGSGLLAAAQNALPGEPLYGVKKITEKGIAAISGQNNNLRANLQLAAKRLEEIDIISQKNLVKNLPAAFYEYKTAKAAAKKEVAELVKKNPAKAGEIIKEAGTAMKNIGEKEKQVYAVLGLESNSSSTQETGGIDYDRAIANSLIDYYNKNGAAIAEEQIRDLTRIKELYAAQEYSQAIDYYLSSSLNK